MQRTVPHTEGPDPDGPDPGVEPEVESDAGYRYRDEER